MGKNFPELLRDIPILLHAGSIEDTLNVMPARRGSFAILRQKQNWFPRWVSPWARVAPKLLIEAEEGDSRSTPRVSSNLLPWFPLPAFFHYPPIDRKGIPGPSEPVLQHLWSAAYVRCGAEGGWKHGLVGRPAEVARNVIGGAAEPCATTNVLELRVEDGLSVVR